MQLALLTPLFQVTSLFIHIYAPFTFTTIRHFYPEATKRFPALLDVPHLHPGRALMLSSAVYIIWQALYWRFVYVGQKEKLNSGKRTTSFSWLLTDTRGMIGRALTAVPAQHRVMAFMAGQFCESILSAHGLIPVLFNRILHAVYSIATELPPVYLLYDSPTRSTIFLFFLFGVSVWNGGGFYIEVFGRKFEKEMEALRKELAEMSASRAATPAESTASLPRDADASSGEEGGDRVDPIEMQQDYTGRPVAEPLSLEEKKSQ